MLDCVKISSNEDQMLFNKQDILSSLPWIEGINFHEEIVVNNIKFVAYNAGHVIGAAMFLIEVNNTRVLYTGDYSREKDIHIIPAELPNFQIDVLIVESTYGIKTHEPWEFR